MFKKTHTVISENMLLVGLTCGKLGIELFTVDSEDHDFPVVGFYRCSDRKFKKLHKFIVDNNLGTTF